MAQGIEGRGSAVKKQDKEVRWGPTDNEPKAAGGHDLKEWGQGRPLFGSGGLKPAKGKLLEQGKGKAGIQRGSEDLEAKTGMGRSHVERSKGDSPAGKDDGGVTKDGSGAGQRMGEAEEGNLEIEKKGGVARMDTEKEGIGGYAGKPNDGKVRRAGADA